MTDTQPPLLARLDRDTPVLIAGPTGAGKSALALRIVEDQGGVVVNADALQVYAEWRILTARPSEADEARAPHRLYGHIPRAAEYSVGAWLREVAAILEGPDRPVIVGGTGLYFAALTEGLAEIPATPPALRAHADTLSLETLRAALDSETQARIDLANRARVQRAWEVLQSTGRGLWSWQQDTAPPLLAPGAAHCLVVDAPKEHLTPLLEARFDAMLSAGALEEVRRNLDQFDPARPGDKAIGARELAAHLRGECSLDAARDAAIIATRQFAKRQRTWFRRRMATWTQIPLVP